MRKCIVGGRADLVYMLMLFSRSIYILTLFFHSHFYSPTAPKAGQLNLHLKSWIASLFRYYMLYV